MAISAKESSVKIYCGPCKDDKNNGDHNTIPQQTRYRLDAVSTSKVHTAAMIKMILWSDQSRLVYQQVFRQSMDVL